jgi:hypothetical protein
LCGRKGRGVVEIIGCGRSGVIAVAPAFKRSGAFELFDQRGEPVGMRAPAAEAEAEAARIAVRARS